MLHSSVEGREAQTPATAAGCSPSAKMLLTMRTVLPNIAMPLAHNKCYCQEQGQTAAVTFHLPPGREAQTLSLGTPLP